MIDITKRARWFEELLSAAERVSPKPISTDRYQRMVAWARSMSLIAEQLADGDA